jgi:uroporphyrinogen-III synthase
MAVLVTRPHPDNETTAATLRARGFEVLLAPMLRFESLAFPDVLGAGYGAVLATSANALRGFESHPEARRLLTLPLFAVGKHTADAARRAGFGTVSASKGGVDGLRDEVIARAKAGKLDSARPLLYLAGADLARDLAGDLGERGFHLVTHTTYRMNTVAELPAAACAAFAANQVDAVLHYSARSARAFVDASRTGGVEISALAIPQCCISDAVAAAVREAGATRILTARSPDEVALFEALERALHP